VNATRRTLGCWLLAAFLERGCDPGEARLPRRVVRVRTLTRREMAEIDPFGPWRRSFAATSNLLPFPRQLRRPQYEV
jgi:hypothetical protein